jgi:hypothetical protein
MKRTAYNNGDGGSAVFDQWVGYGWVRAANALALIAPPHIVIQNYISGTFPLGYLNIADSSLIGSRLFLGVPGLPDNSYSCERIHLKGAGRHGGFQSLPAIWVRPSSTLGWRDTTVYDAGFEVPWAKVATVGTDSSSFETYVYRIIGAPGGDKYFPVAPQQARIAYTVIGTSRTTDVQAVGMKAALSVNTSPNPGARGTWVSLAIPASGPVRVTIVDVSGRVVAKLMEGIQEAGTRRIWWGASDQGGRRCQAGAYWCRVEASAGDVAKRFVLLGR